MFRLPVPLMAASSPLPGWPPGLALWSAGRLEPCSVPTLSSGWPLLDAELPGGGWPLSGLTELLLPPASGELALLAPWLHAMGARSRGPRDCLWIAPPAWPCLAALEPLGLSAARWVGVTPTCAVDAAWTAEQALRSASFAAVLWWQDGPCSTPTLRRLHLAAHSGATPLVALRPPAACRLSSPAPLRVTGMPAPGHRLRLEVFKRRGPPMTTPLLLPLPLPISMRHRPHAVDRPLPASVPTASAALV